MLPAFVVFNQPYTMTAMHRPFPRNPLRRLSAALSVAAAACFAAPLALAAPIPSVVGINHIGVTVPDVKQAVDFFSGVLGCKEVMRFGPFADDKGDFMEQLVNVNPRAVIQQIVMMRCGEGANLELFQYTAPDQKTEQPKNSDLSGHHIAFYVRNIDAAVKDLKARGIKTFMGPFKVDQGPAAGQSICYFLTPWGMQLELITYPKGMAYEKTAKVKLWAAKGQGSK